jgi:hypothetical protein
MNDHLFHIVENVENAQTENLCKICNKDILSYDSAMSYYLIICQSCLKKMQNMIGKDNNC